MAQDSFDLDIPQPPPSGMQPFPESLPPPPAPPRDPHRHVLLAGVVGACVLGAGLGLWARPAEGERRAAYQPAKTAQPAARLARQIQIVVDDAPAPLGPPLEVMRALEEGAVSREPSPPELELEIQPEPEPAAPIRPPAGLVRVLATPEPLEAAEPPPRVTPKPQRQAPSVVEARPQKVRKVETATVEVKKTAPRKAEVTKPEAKALAAKDSKAKARKARADKTPSQLAKAKTEKADSRLAKAKPDRQASKTKLARQDAKNSAAKTKVASAERPRKDTNEVKLAKAQKPASKSPAEKSKAEIAEKAGKLKLAKAQRKPTAKATADKATAAPVRKAAQPVEGGGPLRMVSNRCAATDPAAAMVCADPSLGAADRRLKSAYRRAEAAGVSAGELRRQQQRWLAARAAAAREAPWAVQDVYQARIAELEDLTRGANGGY